MIQLTSLDAPLDTEQTLEVSANHQSSPTDSSISIPNVLQALDAESWPKQDCQLEIASYFEQALNYFNTASKRALQTKTSLLEEFSRHHE